MMRISMQAADESIQSLRAEIEQLTEEFERKNGPIQTADIIIRSQKKAVWNGKPVKQNDFNSKISQQIIQRYATEPCLKEFAKELGITPTALSKRAAAMSVSRFGKKREAA